MKRDEFTLIGRRVLFIKLKRSHFGLQKTVTGGVAIYIICVFLILGCCLFMRVLHDRTVNIATRDTIDDVLVTALTSAGASVNVEEFARGKETIIYRTISPTGIVMNGSVISDTSFKATESPEITMPGMDSFLIASFQRFDHSLTHNLNLDAGDNTNFVGIDGSVTIAEFSVYNKFLEFDNSGNMSNFRFVKYTYMNGGGWTAYPYDKGVCPTVYNSHDKHNVTLTESSVYARLSFTVKVSDYKSFMAGYLNPDSLKQNIEYSRAVSIAKN